MSRQTGRRDLVVLVADKNMDFTVASVLERPKALAIKKITFKNYQHPHRDPGCLNEGADFLRPFVNQFDHALVILDKEGCGREEETVENLEKQIEQKLSVSGWQERAAAVVIDPELENWIWSNSPVLDQELGWDGKEPGLRTWLKSQGLLEEKSPKPQDPKEALERVLKEVRKPRSSAIYGNIAKRVSLQKCDDPSFLKLKTKLSEWFGDRKF